MTVSTTKFQPDTSCKLKWTDNVKWTVVVGSHFSPEFNVTTYAGPAWEVVCKLAKDVIPMELNSRCSTLERFLTSNNLTCDVPDVLDALSVVNVSNGNPPAVIIDTTSNVVVL